MKNLPHILTTPRLYLRRFTLEDTDLIIALNNDAEVLKYIQESLIDTETKALEVLSQRILPYYENNLGRWAVHLKNTNEFIGWCGLKYRAELNETDLGYRYIKQYWRNGYALEAAQHVLNFAFKTLHINEVIGRTHIENKGSLSILQKIGMAYLKNETVDGCPVKTFVAKKQ